MKKAFIIALIFLGFIRVDAQRTISPFPESVHRIVFLGNSITYAGKYITDIEAYFLTHYPHLKIEFINAGLPSETVSGLSEPNHAGGKFPRPDLHERLDRVLAQTKPDWVFACYGMNDGIYLPFDDERFQKFKDGISWLHDSVIKSGAKIIHVTPPVFDERKGKHPGYESVLDTYSGWLFGQQANDQWSVVDVHGPMKKFLEDRIKTDSSFALAKDGVHPGDLGHWIMAQQILLYLGEKGDHINDLLNSTPNDKKIFGLVSQRQAFMKDAWLTSIGHKRPGMKIGLPLKEAQAKADQIEKEILSLYSKVSPGN